MVGRTISDRYRVVELVAMGAMGAVYKGEHLLMRKQVAIKVLHPEIEDFPELVARFEREAIAGAHVNHPNVATASDFGKFDGDSYFLVLEYIEGTTLSDIIKEGPVEPVRAANIAKQLALALGAAHQRGIVHRDVKPRNIMICEPSILDTSARGGDDEIVKLIDFGLAKVPVDKLSTVAKDPVADARDLTNAGVVMGTVAYMAPETALGMSAVQARADFYSLGIIFYEMLAGKHPFDAVDPQKLFAAHCSLPPPKFSERAPNARIPEDLESIVMRLLEKDPSARYPDAESLVGAIDAFKMRVALHGTVSLKRPVLPPKEPAAGTAEVPVSTTGSSGAHYIPMTRRPREVPRVWLYGGIGALAAIAVVVVILLASGGKKNAGEGTASSKVAPANTSASPGTTVMVSAAGGSSVAVVIPSGAPVATPAQVLEAAVKQGPPSAAAALSSVLKSSPESLKDPAVRAKAAEAASAVAEAGLPEATELFDTLATKLGDAGIDVLYAMVAANETSKAGVLARSLLDKPDVIGRASSQLRIAIELRRATCQKRPFLFPQAAKDGDERALAILTAMMPPECDPQKTSPTVCCFMRHGELEKAIADIKARQPAK